MHGGEEREEAPEVGSGRVDGLEYVGSRVPSGQGEAHAAKHVLWSACSEMTPGAWLGRRGRWNTPAMEVVSGSGGRS